VNDGHDQVAFVRTAIAAAMNTASATPALKGRCGQSMAIVARKSSSNHRRMGCCVL
jgi:hypothetical protein